MGNLFTLQTLVFDLSNHLCFLNHFRIHSQFYLTISAWNFQFFSNSIHDIVYHSRIISYSFHFENSAAERVSERIRKRSKVLTLADALAVLLFQQLLRFFNNCNSIICKSIKK